MAYVVKGPNGQEWVYDNEIYALMHKQSNKGMGLTISEEPDSLFEKKITYDWDGPLDLAKYNRYENANAAEKSMLVRKKVPQTGIKAATVASPQTGNSGAMPAQENTRVAPQSRYSPTRILTWRTTKNDSISKRLSLMRQTTMPQFGLVT
jgi:hypothetical protein